MAHKARKRFGQHFLRDQRVLQRIISAIKLSADDCVVEIGPGRAALTTHLLKHLNHLSVVELDRDLVELLKEKFSPDQLTVYACDVLDFDFNEIAQEKHSIRVVGNLPYNISTPLLFKLFSQIDLIKDMHFMLQKEVVQRLCAPVGDHHYSRLTVMAQYYCLTEHLFDVSPKAFVPPPKVDSAVVRLLPRSKQLLEVEDMAAFSDVVKEAFTYRRKTIANALKQKISADALQQLGLDPKLRPQQLSVMDYIKISNHCS